jgi:hypothetical protein
VRTLVAAATGAGHIAIRTLTGLVLTVFFIAYAAVGVLLLPLVAAGFGLATLPRHARAIGRRLADLASWTGVAIRSILIGWISLGR